MWVVMPISQNARFFGEAAPDAEFEHPRGASIVRIIKDSLVQRGWEVSEIDNWRDGGWSVTCCRATSKLCPRWHFRPESARRPW